MSPPDSPARYAKQLLSHLGHKVVFVTDGASSTATIGDGTAEVVVGDNVITLLATGNTEQSVALIEHVLGSHLERFDARHELTVVWTRAAQES